MAKEAAAQTQVPRERHLNIVYFIDSSRTHSVRVNLMHARWLVAGAIGLTLWSFQSLAWIVSLDHVLKTTRDHLSSALGSVFDYQVKYDKIFDKAYPDAALQGYYAEGSHLPANNPTTPEERVAEKIANETAPVKETAPVNQTTTAALTTAKVAAPAAAAAATTVAATTTTANAAKTSDQAATAADKGDGKFGSLDVRKATLSKGSDGKLNLVFDMTNRETKNKAEGYVWAIVGLRLADGTTKNLVAPPTARLNSTGMVENPQSAYRFSIQRYKKKDFSFATPAGDGWTVANIKIVYSDTSGKHFNETVVTPALSAVDATTEEDNDATP